MYKSPVMVVEARSLKERIKTIYLAIKTLNFSYIPEILLVPVPSMYLLSIILFAYSLSSPLLFSGPYRYLGFMASFIFRYVVLLVGLDMYTRIITAKKIGDHDIRREVQGLGGLRAFLIGIFVAAAGVSNVFVIAFILLFIFTAAVIYRYYVLLKRSGKEFKLWF